MNTILFLFKSRAFHLSILLSLQNFSFSRAFIRCFITYQIASIKKIFWRHFYSPFQPLPLLYNVKSYFLTCQHIITFFCLWAVWVRFLIINGYSTCCFKSLSCASSVVFYFFLYHVILVFLSNLFIFLVVLKISIGGFPRKPVLLQTQSQLLRKSSFRSSLKLQVCCSLEPLFTMFCL